MAPKNFGPLSNTLLICNNTRPWHDQCIQPEDWEIRWNGQECQGQTDRDRPDLGNRFQGRGNDQWQEKPTFLCRWAQRQQRWALRCDRVQIVTLKPLKNLLYPAIDCGAVSASHRSSRRPVFFSARPLQTEVAEFAQHQSKGKKIFEFNGYE